MHNAPGDVHEVPSGGVDRLVTQTNAALPFNDVKSLIFVAVNVRGWAAPRWHQGFHHEIGAPLGIRERTVKAHVAKLMRKVGVENRVALTVHAITHSLVPPLPALKVWRT